AIRLLRKIAAQIENIRSRGIIVDLYVNEFKKSKFDLLKASCDDFLNVNPALAGSIKIHYFQNDFHELFPRVVDRIGSVPSLVYLDQNGIKAISSKYFQALEKKVQTDFLYFISSSYFWRFGESEEFKSHLDLDMTEVKNDSY